MEKLQEIKPVSFFDTDTNREFNTQTKDATTARYLRDVSVLNKNRSQYFGMQPTEIDTTNMNTKALARSGMNILLGVKDFGYRFYEEEKAEWLARITDSEVDYTPVQRNMELMKQSNEAFIKYLGIEPTGAEGVISDLYSGAGSLATAIGLTVVSKNPTLATAVFGATATEDIQTELDQVPGTDYETSRNLARGAGVATAILEKIGVDSMLGAMKGNQFIKSTLRSMISEGTQEGLQQIAQDTALKVGGKDMTVGEIANNAVYSAFLGAVLGGGMTGTAIGSKEVPTVAKKIPGAIKNIYNNILTRQETKALQDAGIPEKEFAEFVKETTDKSLTNQDMVNETAKILQRENSNATYQGGDLLKAVDYFKKISEDPERIKTLQQVETKISDRIIQGGGSEQHAKVASALAQTLGVIAQENLGFTPREVKDRLFDLKRMDTKEEQIPEDEFNMIAGALSEEGKTPTTEEINDLWANIREQQEEETRQAEIDAIPETVIEEDGTVTEKEPEVETDQVEGSSDQVTDQVSDQVQDELDLGEPTAKPEPKKRSKAQAKIEDFGEKIGGARKDMAQEYIRKLNLIDTVADVAKNPLSKTFPIPNYERLSKDGVSNKRLVTVALLRGAVPKKPRREYNYKTKATGDQIRNNVEDWANEVIARRALVQATLSENFKDSDITELLNTIGAGESLGTLVDVMSEYSPENYKALQGYDVTSRDQEGKYFLTKAGKYIINRSKENNKSYYVDFSKDDTAGLKEYLDKEILKQDDKPKRKMSFGVYTDRRTKDIFIGAKRGGNVIRVKAGFEKLEEARNYISDNYDDLVDLVKDITKDPTTRKEFNEPRVGKQHINGDVTPEIFADTFKFKGVEFGNWVEGAKRQKDLNEAFDGLMDLADVLDVSPSALSLGGKLGLAFGARGRKGAKAHFERDFNVINLTKKDGAGSLAHEWFHAMDSSLSEGFNMTSDKTTKAYGRSGEAKKNLIDLQRKRLLKDNITRVEVIDAFQDVMETIDGSDFEKESKQFDGRKSSPYWSTKVEMFARAFETYTKMKLDQNNATNDYLVNLEQTFGGVYPSEKDMETIYPAFDKLFQTLDVRKSEKGVDEFYQNGLNTNSQAFKEWFNGSKVVDENGEPLVVYHGSNDEFSTFSKEQIGKQSGNAVDGYYFSSSERTADTYMPDNGKMYKTYLSMKKPYIVDFKGHFFDGTHKFNSEVLSSITEVEQKAKEEGYDGVIANNILDTGKFGINPWESTTYIVFNPNQIKSVDNDGTFSTDDNNIYKQDKRGSFNRLTNTIKIFESADKTTILHETSHWFLTQIEELNTIYNERNGTNLPMFNNISDVIGEPTNGVYSVEQQELFARGFEQFIRSGKVENSRLARAFEMLSKWFKEIYAKMSDLGVKLSPGAKDLYNDILSSPYVNETEFYQDLVEKAQEVQNKIANNEKVSEQDLNDLKEMYSQYQEFYKQKAQLEKEEDFLQFARKRGGYSLETGKSLDLVNTAGLKDVKGNRGLFTKKSDRNENDLIQDFADFTGEFTNFDNARDVANLADRAVDYFEDALATKRRRTETELQIQELDKTIDVLEDQLGFEIKTKPDTKIAQQFAKLGLEEILEDKAYSDLMKIRKLKEETGKIEKYTKEEIKKLQEQVIKVIKQANILPENKAKFLSMIKNVNSMVSFKNNLFKVIDRIERIQEQELKEVYTQQIAKRLADSPYIMQDGKKTARFGYELNKIYEDLTKYKNLSRDKAKSILEELANQEREPQIGDDIRRRFLDLQTQKKQASIALYEKVLNDIIALRREGRDQKLAKENDQKIQTIQDVDRLVDKLKTLKTSNKESLTKLNEYFDRGIGDFYTVLNTLGGKKFADDFNLIKENLNEDMAVFKETNKTNEDVASIFSTDTAQLPYLINGLREEKVGDLIYKDKDKSSVSLNKMNIITMYLHLQNDKLAERYYNAYGKEQIDHFINQLDEKDIELAETLARTVRSYYNDMNKVHIELFNADLPFNQNYFPSRSEFETLSDPMQEFEFMSTTHSALKVRTAGTNTIPVADLDAYAVTMQYIQKAEYMKNTAIKHRRLERLFKDKDVRNLINSKYSKEITRHINTKLENESLNGLVKRMDLIAKTYNKLLGNWTAAKVGLNLSVFIKQWISSVNFSQDMPVKDFAKYFMQGIGNPRETVKFMNSHEFFEYRFKRGGNNLIQEMLTQSDDGGVTKVGSYLNKKIGYSDVSIKKWVSIMQRAGDTGAFMFGGYAKAQYLMKEKGMTQKQALDQVVIEGLNSQQSGLSSQMSDLQTNGFLKIFTLFKSAILQYDRVMKNATLQYQRGEITGQDYAKKMFIFGILNPAIYGGVGYLLSSGFADDDDKMENLSKSIATSILAQPTSGIPVLNALSDPAWSAIIQDKSYSPQIPVVTDFHRAMFNQYSGDLDINAYEFMATTLEVGAGIPIKSLERERKKMINRAEAILD